MYCGKTRSWQRQQQENRGGLSFLVFGQVLFLVIADPFVLILDHHPAADVFLIGEAAHQPAAHPGNFDRIHVQVLFLGHLQRDRLQVVQEGLAAELAAADAHAADHLGFVADADLAHLDAHAELFGQILDQIAEIDPPFRGEVKNGLFFAGEESHPHELDRDLPFLDAVLAVLVGAVFLALFLGEGFDIPAVGLAQDLRDAGMLRVQLKVSPKCLTTFPSSSPVIDWMITLSSSLQSSILGAEMQKVHAALDLDQDDLIHAVAACRGIAVDELQDQHPGIQVALDVAQQEFHFADQKKYFINIRQGGQFHELFLVIQIDERAAAGIDHQDHYIP